MNTQSARKQFWISENMWRICRKNKDQEKINTKESPQEKLKIKDSDIEALESKIVELTEFKIKTIVQENKNKRLNERNTEVNENKKENWNES